MTEEFCSQAKIAIVVRSSEIMSVRLGYQLLYCTLHLWIVHFPKVDLCGRVSRATESECRPLLTLLCRQPMTAPDDAPKVVFTHSHLHMAAQLEKTFERDFLFKKNGRCGMGLGWLGIQSPVSSHLLKRKTEVYINLPPNYHCTLLQHRTKLR